MRDLRLRMRKEMGDTDMMFGWLLLLRLLGRARCILSRTKHLQKLDHSKSNGFGMKLC